MSTITPSKVAAGMEPIPGYVLRRPLGSGGFGEVWLADAPGGLQKAIKFVHGALDEKRAAREMKSLERIRGVNHPFLLTLERFEVVNGQLVIVTELADGSLEDVYRQHVERGSCGIPRKSLMVYINDAADGLDYLNSSFKLQHLDVKPANLLMVGGHVKVADFGLIKDLREIEHSVVGGLTPIYAAPEVFDGRPSARSDQYSLAVMYQELLTGTRPFGGRTIAQLATQHVHSSPNLDPLPPMDRPVVARALEKNPERRFASCMEFVEALREATDRGGVSPLARVARFAPGHDALPGGSGTVVQGGEIEDLGAISAELDGQARPTTCGQALVIGLGGVGADCLTKLRERIDLEEGRQVPDLHLLLVDTSLETVHAAKLSEIGKRISSNHAVHTPLRTAHDYRDSGTERLATISRRWIYNVPRSGATEGLRPLGRMAMVDHGKEIADRLARSIATLAETRGQLMPHVYIVCSLEGGTGSGMIWDVAFLTRYLLDSVGLVDANVIPIVVAPSTRSVGKQTLTTADTYAALGELYYYMQPGNSYPGDPGAGWPSIPAARSPLAHTYVVTRSQGDEKQVDVAETISRYVWSDATQYGPVLAAARLTPQADRDSVALREPAVRSFGIALLNTTSGKDHQGIGRSLAYQAIRFWMGKVGEGRQLADVVASRLAEDSALDADSLVKAAWQPMHSDEAPRWRWLYDLVADLDPQMFAVRKPWLRGGDDQQLDALLARTNVPTEEAEDQVTADVAEMSQRMHVALGSLLAAGEYDLESVVEGLKQFAETLQSAAERHQLSAPRRAQEAADMASTLVQNMAQHPFKEMLGTPTEPGPVMRYLDLRLQAIVDRKLARRLERLAVGVNDLVEGMRTRRATLDEVARNLAGEQGARGNIHEVWKRVDEQLREHRNDLENLTRRALAGNALSSSNVDTPFQVAAAELEQRVVAASAALVERILERLEQKDDQRVKQRRVEQYKAVLAELRPALLACGGRQRLVLVVGSSEDRQMLEPVIGEALGRGLSVVEVAGVEPMLVHEAQGIPLRGVLQRYELLLGGDPKVVGKLKARTDIPWNIEDLA